MYDSPVILEQLELGCDARPPFLPFDPALRVVARRWEALCDGVADATVALFMEGRRPEDRRSPTFIEHQATKVRRGLAVRGRPGRQPRAGGALVGGAFGVADAALVSVFEYAGLRAPQLVEGAYPALRAWAAGSASARACARTAPPR